MQEFVRIHAVRISLFFLHFDAGVIKTACFIYIAMDKLLTVLSFNEILVGRYDTVDVAWCAGQPYGSLHRPERRAYDTSFNLPVSDSTSVIFGCRDLSSYVDPALKSRVFVCNGQLLFIRGGNWIVADGMLR